MPEYIDRETTKVFLRENGVCDDITDLINYVPASKDIERVLDAYGRCMTLRSESSNRLSIIREILTSRLQEIAQSEKDGRLEVLPCKVGDILYEVDLPEYGVITCKAVSISHYSGPMFHVPGNEAVKSLTVEVEVIEGHGKGSSYNFEIDEFGKTIFLTRQAAEEALREEAENG